MAQVPNFDAPSPSELMGRELATAMVMFHEAVGRLLGLSAVERKCLDALRRLGPVPAGVIGKHTGLTTGAVTGLMDRLERAGYVRRTRDEHDRRKVVVQLLPNPEMDRRLGTAFGPFAGDMVEIAGHYTEDEQRAISDWIKRTTEALTVNTHRVMNLDIP
jgi:DNA-binding Lrp family transcriptional regulator